MKEAEGRVVKVRPRSEGNFAVTVGPAPALYWFVSDHPPRLGALVRIAGHASEVRSIASSGVQVTVLDDVTCMVVPEPWARREVAKVWLDRVKSCSKRVLYPFQSEGAGWVASRLSESRGAILADEPGLGKTTQTIAGVLAANSLPCLIVCPATIKDNWAREIRLTSAWDLPVEVVNPDLPLPRSAFIVMNYEQLKRREQQLALHGIKTVVFDEAHAIKNPGAKGFHRAAIATRLALHIKRVVLLTGSPVLNRPTELWRLLYLSDPTMWEGLEYFRARYCTQRDSDVPGSVLLTDSGVLANAEELHVRAAPSLLRRMKAQVLHQLPAKKRRVMRVPMPASDEAHYRAAEADVVAWLKKLGNVLTPQKRSEAIVRLTTLRRLAALAKLHQAFPAYLRAWVEKVKRPIAVFAYHKDVVAGALRAARLAGCTAIAITSALKPADRQAVVDAFSRGEYFVLVCPLMIAGVGLNLQRACRDMVFLERLFVPALMDQAEDRCHRIGQLHEVTCTYIDAERTIDDHIARVLLSKRTLVDHTIGDVVSRLAQAKVQA